MPGTSAVDIKNYFYLHKNSVHTVVVLVNIPVGTGREIAVASCSRPPVSVTGTLIIRIGYTGTYRTGHLRYR